MHDHEAEGNEFFKCDFCGRAWSDDRPMVEGHQGSLICAACLRVAYTEVVLQGRGGRPPAGATCTMCLEERRQRHFASPIRKAWCCERCVRQSARALEKDPDSGWTVPR